MGFLARMFGRAESPDLSAATLMAQGVKVIDVRSRGEFNAGHIASAKCLDVGSFDFTNAVKRLNPKHTYIVYCQSGSRSSRAASTMRAAGLTVHDGGGIASMQARGWRLGA